MKHCNLDYLKSIIPEDNSFAIRIIELFLEDVPASMESMREAAAGSNWMEVYTHAHKIKPSVQLIGVSEKMMETLLRVVAYSKSESETEQLPGLIAYLNEELKHIYTELADELKSMKA
jgi:HPt (histidine-containing phosphotransfer) domain-containing protein